MVVRHLDSYPMSKDRLLTLLEYLEDKPEDSFLLFAVAKEYEQRDDLSQALTHFLKLKTVDPEYIGLYYHLGKLYENINEDHHAIATYNQGIALAKKIGDFHALSELNNSMTNLKLQLGN